MTAPGSLPRRLGTGDALLIMTLDLREAIGFSPCGVLVYYFVAHAVVCRRGRRVGGVRSEVIRRFALLKLR